MDENVPMINMGMNHKKATEKGGRFLTDDVFDLVYKKAMASTVKMLEMINSGARMISPKDISFFIKCSQNSLKLNTIKIITVPKLPTMV